MKAILETFRILTSALGAISVLVAALIVGGINIISYWPQVILGILVVFFFSAASNMFNDYIDRESDKKNHPERPIPSGRLKPKTALITAIILFFLTIIGGWFINIICFEILFNVFSNFIVSFCDIDFSSLI